MVYKICLTGTSGTGKTSLAILAAGELKRRGVEARALAEMSTLAVEKGLPINEGTTLDAQLWILHQQFAEEIAHQARTTPPKYDVIIGDRGPDNYCYLERRFGVNEYALQMTLGHMTIFPYQQMYLLPIVAEALPSGDGIRSTSTAFQQEMDERIRTFFNDHQIHYIELPKRTDHLRDEWVRIVVNQTLADLGKAPQTRM